MRLEPQLVAFVVILCVVVIAGARSWIRWLRSPYSDGEPTLNVDSVPAGHMPNAECRKVFSVRLITRSVSHNSVQTESQVLPS
jgi:hypothetical protein